MANWQVLHDVTPEIAARVREVLRPLRPHRLIGGEKLRVGRLNDGGYVMIDRFDGTEAAYSLGINDDVSWDVDIARLGIPVFQYDHTIPGLPEQHPLFDWKPICIAGYPDGPNTDSLEGLIAKNGHEGARDLLLKCDIEGAEWPMLQALPNAVLRQFRQIVMEIHFMEYFLDVNDANNMRRSIMNLTASHHLVHVHANNFAPLVVRGGYPVPNVIEVTLVRKDVGEFVPSDESFPTPLDMPCNSNAAELHLGRFTFD